MLNALTSSDTEDLPTTFESCDHLYEFGCDFVSDLGCDVTNSAGLSLAGCLEEPWVGCTDFTTCDIVEATPAPTPAPTPTPVATDPPLGTNANGGFKLASVPTTTVFSAAVTMLVLAMGLAR